MDPTNQPSQTGSYVRYGRYWKVSDPDGKLICLTVYKCGAKEVLRRLETCQEEALNAT